MQVRLYKVYHFLDFFSARLWGVRKDTKELKFCNNLNIYTNKGYQYGQRLIYNVTRDALQDKYAFKIPNEC